MKEWLVSLEGDTSDLQQLLALPSSLDLTVIEEQGNYYLKSKVFAPLTNAGDVRASAEHMLNIANGVLRFFLGNFRPVKVMNAVIAIDEGRKRQYYYEGTVSVQVRAKATTTVVQQDGTAAPRQSPSHLECLFSLARQNKNVADALHFFQEPTWLNLYKVYEIIRDDVGGESKIIERAWIKKGGIRLFRQTAQSRKALGDDARHASKKYKPPKKPMSLSEAESLIRILLKNWLQSGVGSQLLTPPKDKATPSLYGVAYGLG